MGSFALALPSFSPPTDPEAFFPPADSTDEGIERAQEGASGVITGFEYPLHDVVVESERLRGAFSSNELFADWCAIQSSEPAPAMETGYYCYASADGGFSIAGEVCRLASVDAPDTEIPCAQAILCGNCNCTADGCVASVPLDSRIDGALDEDQENLTGAVSIDGISFTVRLERQP